MTRTTRPSEKTVPCSALTAAGTPCRQGGGAHGLCAWHDPARKPPPRSCADAPRVCRECGYELPARKFGSSGQVSPEGVGYRKRTCLLCEAKARRAAGIPERHARYDAHGQVWCAYCQHYLHAEHFRHHPSRPYTYWAYCRACTRSIDRHRDRAIRGTAAWTHAATDRAQRQRRQRTREHEERRVFVANTIMLLGRRGFTQADIARLTGTSQGSLSDWVRRARRVLPNTAKRFAELLRLTADIPLAPEPVQRRRRPHPEVPRLMAAMAPAIARYPVRANRMGREGWSEERTTSMDEVLP